MKYLNAAIWAGLLGLTAGQAAATTLPVYKPVAIRPVVRPPAIRPVIRPPVVRPPMARPISGPMYHPPLRGGVPGPVRAPGGLMHAGPVGAPRAYSNTARYSYNGRSFAAVRAPAYRYARGFGYRRFGIGQRFPAFLLMSQYFVLDYYLYNLAPPPPNFMWVRFGPDVVLVNTYNGLIRDYAPGVFDEGAAAPGISAPPPAQEAGPDAGDGPSAPQTDGDGTAYPGPNGYPGQ